MAQILLGALNVWLGEHAGLVVAHLTLGTLLWATVVYAALSWSPGARRGASPIRAARTEARPAPA